MLTVDLSSQEKELTMSCDGVEENLRFQNYNILQTIHIEVTNYANPEVQEVEERKYFILHDVMLCC